MYGIRFQIQFIIFSDCVDSSMNNNLVFIEYESRKWRNKNQKMEIVCVFFLIQMKCALRIRVNKQKHKHTHTRIQFICRWTLIYEFVFNSKWISKTSTQSINFIDFLSPVSLATRSIQNIGAIFILYRSMEWDEIKRERENNSMKHLDQIFFTKNAE